MLANSSRVVNFLALFLCLYLNLNPFTASADDYVLNSKRKAPDVETDHSQASRFALNKRLLELADIPNLAVNSVTKSQHPNPIRDALRGISRDVRVRQRIGDAISNICPNGVASASLQRDCNLLVGAAFSASEGRLGEARDALEQLTFDSSGSATHASQTGVSTQTRNIGTRISGLRSQANNTLDSTLNVSFNGSLFSADELLNRFNNTSRDSTNSEGLLSSRAGMFFNGSYSSGERDDSIDEEGFEFGTRGVTAGIDYRFSDALVLGAAVGYLDTQTDLNRNGGRLDTRGWSATLYGTLYQSDQFFIDAIASYGSNVYEQDRSINYTLDVTTVNQTLSADYDGDQYSATIGAGYHMTLGSVTITPTARFEYVSVKLDAYEEVVSDVNGNGGGWGMRLSDQDVESQTFSVGADVSKAISRSWGVWLPQLSLAWVREFEGDSRVINGNFLGDTSRESILLPLDAADDNYFNLRVNFLGQFAQGNSFYIYYQKLLAYDGLDIDSYGLGFRLEI